MRSNLPVTGREYPLADDVTLLSTTDTESRITYANTPFVEISGFGSAELLGQPHNIVRQPDMPPEAFADMWRTLQAGHAWSALVKNRRRDGDHYWVRANAAPRVSAGKVVGYLSVRTRPSTTEVQQAEAFYRSMKAGHAKGWALYRGLTVRTGRGFNSRPAVANLRFVRVATRSVASLAQW